MTLLLGVLVASLVGSIHCAAMCGAFVCLYSGTSAPRGVAGMHGHAAYNLGRLASYVTLGLLAGSLGARVDAVGQFAGIGRAAAILAGSLMVAWAIGIIASSLGLRVVSLGAPQWARRRLGAIVLAARGQPMVIRAGVTGLVTSLLPCGWLYTFVVTAGGTGRPLAGAVVMAAFWIGTVPMMLGVGLGAHRIVQPLARRLPAVSAAVILVLGLLSIAGKVRAPGSASANTHSVHVARPAR